MKASAIVVTALVAVFFVVSVIVKSSDATLGHAFGVTFAAFLTLFIFSFMYRDNPFYKFAEHLYVGVSAAFWMSMGFWTTIVGNLVPRISGGPDSFFDLCGFFEVPYDPENRNYFYIIPIVLGFMLLMRLSRNHGWIARWPLAWIVGTTAGLNFIRYLRSDFIEQVSSTFVPLAVDWQGFGPFVSQLSLNASGQLVSMLTNWIIFLGVFCGLVYFFFSKEHTGLFGRASRMGIWILMLTFGASFGYTVMGRISLLVGRITFLFKDWLGLIS